MLRTSINKILIGALFIDAADNVGDPSVAFFAIAFKTRFFHLRQVLNVCHFCLTPFHWLLCTMPNVPHIKYECVSVYLKTTNLHRNVFAHVVGIIFLHRLNKLYYHELISWILFHPSFGTPDIEDWHIN